MMWTPVSLSASLFYQFSDCTSWCTDHRVMHTNLITGWIIRTVLVKVTIKLKSIIEYGSILYVGMARKKYCCLYKSIASVRARTDIMRHFWSFKPGWQCLPNRFMIKKRHNSDGKLSRAASQHGSKIDSFFFFFSVSRSVGFWIVWHRPLTVTGLHASCAFQRCCHLTAYY